MKYFATLIAASTALCGVVFGGSVDALAQSKDELVVMSTFAPSDPIGPAYAKAVEAFGSARGESAERPAVPNVGPDAARNSISVARTGASVVTMQTFGCKYMRLYQGMIGLQSLGTYSNNWSSAPLLICRGFTGCRSFRDFLYRRFGRKR